MTKVNIHENFVKIHQSLEEHGLKPTTIAMEIGYTTTAQLNSTLSGQSMLSTKAIIGLIENLRVNPTFLFLGKGEMFITDETELERIQKEYSELERKFFANQDDLLKCKQELEIAVRRYNKLIDITSIALDKTQNTGENKDKD